MDLHAYRTGERGQMVAVLLAAGWAFLFAAMSFYWALGGVLGVSTLGAGIEELAERRAAADLAGVWVTGVLKAVAGALVLALPRPPASDRIRQALWWLVVAAGALFVLYGLANGVQHALMATGEVDIARTLGSEAAVRWHLFFWDPFWLLGGVLFLEAARRFARYRRLASENVP